MTTSNDETLSLFEVTASPDASLVGRKVRAHTKGEARSLLRKLLLSSLPVDPVLKEPRLPKGTVLVEVEAGKKVDGAVLPKE